jgi:hypothetical protein
MKINFAEVARIAFTRVLGSDGQVVDSVVYKMDEKGEYVKTNHKEKEITDMMEAVRKEIQYKTEREAIYPSIEDQLDQLWHGMNEDATKRIEPFYSNIKAVKEAFPKDGSKNPPLEILDT